MSGYRLIEPVGRGAFGVVWRAEAVGPDGFVRQVAVKILDPRAMADAAGKRFRDEARILGRLRHRAIVRVENLTQIDGQWAIVAEYVDGADLGQVILGGMPPRVALEVCEEVAGALHEAWSQVDDHTRRPLRLVHRDVKPGNIRLTRHGEVRLLDFGIARADFEGRESDTTRGRMGTPRYMAPERADAIDGPEGDVYALGLVLAEALVAHRGDPPPKHPERHKAFVADRVARVRAAAAGTSVADELPALVERMLAYEHTERPSAREVELAARDLATRAGTPSLRQWAEQAVAGLPRPVVLPEPSDASPLPATPVPETPVDLPPAPPRRGRAGVGLAVLGVGLALLTLTLGTVSGAVALALWASQRPEAAADGAPPVDPAPVAAPEAPPAPTATTPEPEPERAPAPPAARPPNPEPAVPAPPRTSVRVTGAHAVTLMRDGAPPVVIAGGAAAEVERGRWRLFVAFAPGEPVLEHGFVEVDQEPVHVVCARMLLKCRLSRG